nr:hypothetical protein [Agarivorans aestuarii]
MFKMACGGFCIALLTP